MLRTHYILVIVFLSVCASIKSQTHNIVFEDFTTDGVMKGKSVIKIAQDEDGFLWFGALEGLYRYDGSRVKVFQYDENDSTSLSDNYVRALFVDSKGTLWVGSWNNGLNKYDPEKEAFVRYQNDPEDPKSISSNSIEDIMEDHNGRLWVATGSNGLNLFDPEDGTFQRFEGPQPFTNDSLWVVLEDKDQKLWVGHRNGVDLMDSETFQRAQLPTDFDRLKNTWVTAIHEDLYGDIWLGTWRDGLFRWRKNAQSLEEVRYDNGLELLGIKDFLNGPKGRLWITAEKFGFFDFEENRATAYGSAESASFRMEQATNWPIFQDKEGLIWIGRWGGISRHNPRMNFYDYTYQRLFKEEPFFDDPIQFTKDDEMENLWIVWKEAVGYWDLKEQTMKYFDLKGKLVYKGEPFNISNIFRDTRGFLWLLSHAGPFRLDPETKELIHLNDLLANSYPGLYVHTPHMVEGISGDLWISSMEGGLYRYNYLDKSIKNFNPSPVDPGSISYNLVDALSLEGDSILWVGTYGAGVDRFDIRTEKVTHRFRHIPSNSSSLSQDRILSLMEDDHGKLWIGTEDGLNILDKKSLTVTNLSKSIDLEKGNYRQLKKNHKGQIVCNHEGALLIIDPIDLTYEKIGQLDGLMGLNKELYSISQFALMNSKNRMYFVASKNNIVSFQLDSLQKNSLIPPVKITGLSYRRMENAREKQYELKGLSKKKSVKLSYQDDLITIDFAALSFVKSAQNQFKYRLLPSNPNWISLGYESSVNFMNLPPRKYTFEVMGSNGDGVWNPEPTSLEIIITPPWWASSLARILYLLGFVAALIIFVRIRIQSLVKRQKVLEESVAERTRELAIAKQEAEEASEAKSIFLSTVSHELRTPLTSIIGFTKLNKKSLEERILPSIDPSNEKALKAAQKLDQNLDIVSTEGRRLTTLINDLLDLAKIEAGKVEWKVALVNPHDIFDQALSSTAVLFNEKNLHLKKNIQKDLAKIRVDKDRIIQVIINLISNAVKFTDKGTVTVTAKQEDSHLLVCIEDTGKGIAFEDLPKVFEKFKQVGDNMTDKPQGTGLGLPICKEIIDFHKGEIWVESKEGEGSAFSFLLPIKNNE